MVFLIKFQQHKLAYTPKHKIRMKQVRFRSIEIIELAIALGDNPCVSAGAPLTTEWEAQSRSSFEIDFFEKNRPRRRSAQELVISSRAREHLLLKHGYAMEDIFTASKTASQAKRERKESSVDKMAS
jgi:hypothetical protein